MIGVGDERRRWSAGLVDLAEAIVVPMQRLGEGLADPRSEHPAQLGDGVQLGLARLIAGPGAEQREAVAVLAGRGAMKDTLVVEHSLAGLEGDESLTGQLGAQVSFHGVVLDVGAPA